MRLLKGGKVLGSQWQGFHVWGDTLHTPEGRRLHFSDLAWWSLLVLQAQQWRNLFAEQNGREPTSVASSMLRHCNAPKPLLRSKRGHGSARKAGKRGNVDKLSTQPPSFHRSERVTSLHDRTACPVGPDSNTGQKVASDLRKSAVVAP